MMPRYQVIELYSVECCLFNAFSCIGYLSYKRADIDDLIEELCSDLVIALREGTTFRLLKVSAYCSTHIFLYCDYFFEG